MKHILAIAVIAALLLAVTGCGQNDNQSRTDRLSGIAEDLWGNSVDLSAHSQGITLIQPFSPSNCGYCLFDGEFVAMNYFDRNTRAGGSNFHQCLFSPQLDVYAYVKHYRETTPVLTFPLSLHDYHRNGFPNLMAFRDDRQIYNGSYSDWAADVHKLSAEFWPDQPASPVRLPSGFKMANNFMSEKGNTMIVRIVPDGDTAMYAELIQSARDTTLLITRYESQLTPDDMNNHAIYIGPANAFSFAMLDDQDMPIKMDSAEFHIGDYTFPRATTGCRAMFPNPFNREKYLQLIMRRPGTPPSISEPWIDFYFYRYDSLLKADKVVLDGLFAKGDNNNWRFADSLAVVYANLVDFCKGGVCPMPPYMTRPVEHHTYDFEFPNWTGLDSNTLTMGVSACRFAAIAVNPDGVAGVAWEENGDIVFAVGKENERPRITLIEDGLSDSYNPRVTWDGQSFFIAWLSDKEIYYRLYGRYYDNGRLSNEITLSDPGCFDVFSPALASDGRGEIAVAWSEWKANYRYPRYRIIADRVPDKSDSIPVVPSGLPFGYTNAWWVSLAFDADGRLYGSWNQHYPATVTPCGGPIDGTVAAATHLTGDVETSEIGEYPATAVAPDGRQWMTWTSFGWDAWRGEPQRVLVSCYDTATASWASPYTVSVDGQTLINRSPKIAIDGDGILSVVWSGRNKDVGSNSDTWGIYVSSFIDGAWSSPRLISEPGVCARAPEIATGPDKRLWVTWHSGIGDNMKITLRILPEVSADNHASK